MWYAVYETATGALRSVGTVLADPLPAGLSSVAIGQDHPSGDWDSASRTFVPRSTLPERWTKFEFLMRMTPAERKACRARAEGDEDAADFMDMLNQSGEVVRSNPAVLQGLTYMASVGCMAAGRPSEILNG